MTAPPRCLSIPVNTVMYINEYSPLGPKERRQLFYKRLYKAQHPAWDDSMVMLTQLVDQHTSAPIDVLDLGCGRGNFLLDELPHKWKKRIGVDASVEATERNTSVQTIVYGDISSTLPFPDAHVDLVTGLWVMEHVEHPHRVLAEVARVLKPGGIFAFVTPNRNSMLIRLRMLLSDALAGWLLTLFYGRTEQDVFPIHYRLNTLKHISEQLARVHLVPLVLQVNVDPSYTSFGPISYLLSRLFSALPISLSHPHVICLAQKPEIPAP